MKSFRLVLPALFAIALCGCRAHMVKITLVNASAEPISTVIVDYPSATFGKDKLAPREEFSSVVKITDTGAINVQFVDAKGVSHSYKGPTLHQNAVGSVIVTLEQTGVRTAVNSTTP
ncbi:MAG TPA: hypothetical protein VLC94_04185 [Candidatus Acidoferrum sp.]|nr:hypothetical protein [Candidatus Acidoferrum sp.]